MPAQGKKASGSKGGAAPKKAAQGAQAEKRLDPHSGKTLTFSELETMYRGKYGKAEIDQYWRHECKVVKAEAKAKAEAETTKTKEDAEQKAKEEEAEAKAKNEADVKAKAEEVQAKAKEAEDSGAKAKEEAEAKAKEEAEAKAKADAEARAKEDAEAKAREEAEEKAKEEAETKAKEEADIKAKEEAEQKAKEEAELKAKEMAEAKAKEEVESKAREEEAAAKDSEDAERKAKEESAGDEPLSRESTRSPSATEMVGSSVSVKCETSFGECVAMVGSAQALGAWDPSKALRLTTDASSYPTWTAQLPECPAAGMEFKFVILQGDGSAKWEPIPGNREWPNHNLSGGPVGVSARFGEEPMTTSTSQ